MVSFSSLHFPFPRGTTTHCKAVWPCLGCSFMAAVSSWYPVNSDGSRSSLRPNVTAVLGALHLWMGQEGNNPAPTAGLYLSSHSTLQNYQGNHDSPCALQCSWNCRFVGLLKKEAWGSEWSPGCALISVEDWSPWFAVECVCQNAVPSGNVVVLGD